MLAVTAMRRTTKSAITAKKELTAMWVQASAFSAPLAPIKSIHICPTVMPVLGVNISQILGPAAVFPVINVPVATTAQVSVVVQAQDVPCARSAVRGMSSEGGALALAMWGMTPTVILAVLESTVMWRTAFLARTARQVHTVHLKQASAPPVRLALLQPTHACPCATHAQPIPTKQTLGPVAVSPVVIVMLAFTSWVVVQAALVRVLLAPTNKSMPTPLLFGRIFSLNAH
jgi:hypothetical protein